MRKRKYRRRKKSLKIKSQTIFSILGFLTLGAGIIIFLSFFAQGTMLYAVNDFTRLNFGTLSIVLPFVLMSFSLPFFRIKSVYTRPQIAAGSLLVFICLLALSKGGRYGEFIWDSLSFAISPVGSFLLLFIMIFIGLLVVFNTSVEEVFSYLIAFYKSLSKYIKEAGEKRRKAQLIEKLPIKPPLQYPKQQDSKKMDKHKESTDIPPKTADLEKINVAISSNFPATTSMWEYPPLTLLDSEGQNKADRGDVKRNADIIEKTLESFGVSAQVVEVNYGPQVTQYALDIAVGTKLTKITALSKDLALALASNGQIRIEAPIPGRRLVGIEVPNIVKEFVTLKEMLSTEKMQKSRDKLLVSLGLDVKGEPSFINIAKMPHVLIAGATGSGKSVLINSWISSILYRTSPAEVRLILIDPKRVELTLYDNIPHLLAPVVTDHKQIISTLKWAVEEMSRRYKTFQEMKVRNIDSFNELTGLQSLPYIVIFIDELAELMAFAPSDVEEAITRLSQLSRATGIHLVIATQRPSVDVITGLIKANIPARIAFMVTSGIDSRVIIDTPGADKLGGMGDMLYLAPDKPLPMRIQGTFVSEKETKKIVEFFHSKKIPLNYTQEVTQMKVSSKSVGGETDSEKDDLFDEAVRVICQYDRASASLLQRRLSIGYARAARIIDQLEMEGLISAGEGSKPREVIIKNPQQYFELRDAQNQSA